jgi:hypothetical protein
LKEDVPFSSKQGRPHAVLVVGCARSGTSAFCGVLSALGVAFGDLLKPPDRNNLRGNFEDLPLSLLNQKVLAAFGSSWSDARPLPESWLDHEEVAGVIGEMTAYLKKNFGHHPLFGIKDPRMTILFPLYGQIFKSLDWPFTVIAVVRDEEEVIASIGASGYYHGDYTPEKGRQLHQHYLNRLAAIARSVPVKHVTYHDLIHSTPQVIDFLCETLPFKGAGIWPDKAAAIRSIDPALRHHHSRSGTGETP